MVIPNVYWFCQAYPCLMSLKCKGESLQNTLATIQKEQALHLKRVQTHIKDMEEVKAQLVAAQVHTHIKPIMAQLAVDGIIPDAIFTQYFGSTDVGHPNNPPRQAHPIIDLTPSPIIPHLRSLSLHPIIPSSEV